MSNAAALGRGSGAAGTDKARLEHTFYTANAAASQQFLTAPPAEVLSAALDYASRDWPVFPAPRGEKKSHKSAEYSGGRKWGATDDPEEIRADLERWPEANVGIVTGPQSGVLVVEADTPEGHDVDGLANLAALTERHGALPETVEAVSPSGSRHYYFRYPLGCDIRNSAGLIAPGVDVRGDGGMVIAPPSVKPGHDVPYRWANPPGLFDLADCPEWLLELCEKKANDKVAIAPESIGTGCTAWADTALRGEIADLLAAPEGQRNAALNSAAFSLGQIIAGGALAEAYVHQRLTAAAQGIGLGAGEVEATIKSGLTAGMAEPRRPKDEAPAARQKPGVPPEANTEATPAAEPVDLWGSFDPPELPPGLLPPILEQFARANGDQMGADPSGLALAALVTCAAAIPDQVTIKVKRHGDWTESPRIWVVLVGSPSTKKTPIISAATCPLCAIDMRLAREYQEKAAAYAALPKEVKRGKAPPPQTRLRLEDTTVEAAQQVLEGSPWGVLLLQDEMTAFFGSMDRYTSGKAAQADRAFWLRTFNGGPYAWNRVGRGTGIIDNLSMSLLGGIQPEPLRKIAGDSADDGLLQRLFPIMLRTATMGRDEPMPPINEQYKTLIECLHRLRLPGFFGCHLEFDDGAQRIRRDLEARHLELQSTETVSGKLASHIGKYDGLFARLCIIWHCVEHVEKTALCDEPGFDGVDLPATVTGATAQRVADFLHDFLLPHAVAFYSGVLGLSDDHDRLTAIAGYILAHKLEKITNRDVQRGDRTMRGLRDFEIKPLLEQLDALGWLDRIDPPRPTSPPHWQVNPAVHEKFADRAEREASRRKEARETIAGLMKS